jgi:hypothetical protein
MVREAVYSCPVSTAAARRADRDRRAAGAGEVAGKGRPQRGKPLELTSAALPMLPRSSNTARVRSGGIKGSLCAMGGPSSNPASKLDFRHERYLARCVSQMSFDKHKQLNRNDHEISPKPLIYTKAAAPCFGTRLSESHVFMLVLLAGSV